MPWSSPASKRATMFGCSSLPGGARLAQQPALALLDLAGLALLDAHRLDRELAADLRVLGEEDLAHRAGAERAARSGSGRAGCRRASGAHPRSPLRAAVGRPRSASASGVPSSKAPSRSSSTRSASSSRSAGTLHADLAEPAEVDRLLMEEQRLDLARDAASASRKPASSAACFLGAHDSDGLPSSDIAIPPETAAVAGALDDIPSLADGQAGRRSPRRGRPHLGARGERGRRGSQRRAETRDLVRRRSRSSCRSSRRRSPPRPRLEVEVPQWTIGTRRRRPGTTRRCR